jgi:ribonuclease E/ribonuclease G
MLEIDTLVLTGGPGERRIALLASDEVMEFVIDRGEPLTGDIIQGRVKARAGAGTFVEIGAALPGYLPRPGDWHEGQSILVQVTAEARPDKGAVLTDKVPAGSAPFRSGGLGRTLQREKAISRLLVDQPALLAEAKRLFPGAQLQRGVWRDCGAADALEFALSRAVALPEGGRVIFDQAAAATLIDIDAGGLDRDEANRLAMGEIARQLRLRNIAGQILIDAIPGDSPKSIQQAVEALKRHLAADPIKCDLLGVTKMRMIELVRPRRRPSLSDYFLSPPQPKRNAAGLALEALQAVLAEAEAAPHRRLSLLAPPAVTHYLNSRPELLAECAERLGRPLPVAARSDLEGFAIVDQP